MIKDFITLSIAQSLDWFMIYYFCHKMINKKPRPFLGILVMGCLYGIIFGMIAYFLDADIARIIVTTTGILIFKLISNKKIQDALILYGIFILINLSVQTLVILVLLLLGLGLSDFRVHLFVQAVTLAVILILNQKSPLNRLLYIIERQIVLKAFIYMMTIVSLAVLFIFSHQQPASFYVFFATLLMISCFGFIQTIRKISFYTGESYAKMHDVKNMIISLHATANATADIEEIRKGLAECMVLMDLDAQLEGVELDKDEENLYTFIQQKKDPYDDAELDAKILFLAKNKDLSLTIIMYMLGTLLDNALEHHGNKPILVKVLVSEQSVNLSVSNAYDQKNAEDLNKIFEKGYSTKSGAGHGYGLSNLVKAVERYSGELKHDYSYNEEYETNYLTLEIVFKSNTAKS